MTNTGILFEKLVAIMAELRSPQGGCPWDLEQTHKSITAYLIEEAYEVIEAIEDEDDKELAIELGDLLLQVVFHAQMAKDRGAFDIDQVIENISTKLIRRHPHVFGQTQVNGASDVIINWEAIKQEERKEDAKENTSYLAGIPKAMPALLRAQRMGERAARVNFDWSDLESILAKVDEEVAELKVEINDPAAPKQRVSEELGDLLFALTQLARKLDLRAEDCLRDACEKFQTRFMNMESIAERPLKEYSLAQLDELWIKVKG
ncbi:MAG: nucleoside triphosphate pyrophosphohydrolase [Deltaproteobacteria bacterium]|nr:nucleoside triphosphate pyrophosphohydrolase [Deltaproteobacteria bacterium]